jgi:exonuclease VII small subunit
LNEITDEVVKESGSIDLEEALEGYKRAIKFTRVPEIICSKHLTLGVCRLTASFMMCNTF